MEQDRAAAQALPQRSRRRRRDAHLNDPQPTVCAASVSAPVEQDTGGLEEETRRLVLEETGRVNEWFEAQLTACSPDASHAVPRGGRRAHDDTTDSRPERRVANHDAREQQADDADEQEISARCTHFVSIPVDNISLLHRVATVQDDIVSAEPALRPGLIDRRSLHLTLAALVVESDALSHLRAAFQEQLPRLMDENLQGALSLPFSGLGHFNDRVLFLRPEPNTDALRKVTCLVEDVRSFLEHMPGVSVDPVPFRPHVTLLKTSKLPPGAQKRFRHGIEKKLYMRHKDLRSGSQRIGVLELNAMRINPATGKFITCASVSPLSRSPLHSASQDSAHTYTARDVMHIPAGARTSAFGKSFSGADGEAGHANEEESWRDPNAVRLRSLENSAADDCESVGGGGSERRRRRGRLQQRYMPPANE